MEWLILGGILVAIVGVGVVIYNGLVGRKVEKDSAWSQIDVQLKRRHDLIPNLVETVKGYAAHEKDTLERVIAARNMAVNAKSVGEHSAAENQLTGALKTIFALSESYPDLKANTNFLSLQEELSSTENRIGFARQHYNDVAAQYNGARMRFPAVLIAGMFGFEPAEYFQLDPGEAAAARKAPEVKF